MLNPKRNCYHFRVGKCNILTDEGGRLNCQIHKCSFFETKKEYEERQAKTDAKQHERDNY